MRSHRLLLLVVLLVVGWTLFGISIEADPVAGRASTGQRSTGMAQDVGPPEELPVEIPRAIEGHGFQRTLEIYAERGQRPLPYYGKDAKGKSRVIFPGEVFVPIEPPLTVEAFASADASQRLAVRPKHQAPGYFLVSIPPKVSEVDFVARGFAKRRIDVSEGMDGPITFVPNARIKVALTLPTQSSYAFSCSVDTGSEFRPILLLRRYVSSHAGELQQTLEVEVPSLWTLSVQLKPRFGDTSVRKITPLIEGEDRVVECDLTEPSRSFHGQLTDCPDLWRSRRLVWLSYSTPIGSQIIASRSTTTDAEGRFEFQGVTAGLDFSISITGAHQNTISLADSAGSSVFQGPSEAPVLMDCSDLTGVLITKNGKAIEDYVIHAEPNTWAPVFTQANGIGLLPMSLAANFAKAWLVLKGGGSTPIRIDKKLRPQTIVTVDIGEMHRLTARANAPLPRAGSRLFLYAINASGARISGEQGEDKAWSFQLPKGDYSLIWCFYGGGEFPAISESVAVDADTEIVVTPPSVRAFDGLIENWEEIPEELRPHGVQWGGDFSGIKHGKFKIRSLSTDLDQLQLNFGMFDSCVADSRISENRLLIRIKQELLCQWELKPSKELPKEWGGPQARVRDSNPCERYDQLRLNGWEIYGSVSKVGLKGQHRAGFLMMISKRDRHLAGWFSANLKGSRHEIPINTTGRWVTINGNARSALQVYACGPHPEVPPIWIGAMGTQLSSRFWVPSTCKALDFVRLGEQKPDIRIPLSPHQTELTLN